MVTTYFFKMEKPHKDYQPVSEYLVRRAENSRYLFTTEEFKAFESLSPEAQEYFLIMRGETEEHGSVGDRNFKAYCYYSDKNDQVFLDEGNKARYDYFTIDSVVKTDLLQETDSLQRKMMDLEQYLEDWRIKYLKAECDFGKEPWKTLRSIYWKSRELLMKIGNELEYPLLASMFDSQIEEAEALFGLRSRHVNTYKTEPYYLTLDYVRFLSEWKPEVPSDLPPKLQNVFANAGTNLRNKINSTKCEKEKLKTRKCSIRARLRESELQKKEESNLCALISLEIQKLLTLRQATDTYHTSPLKSVRGVIHLTLRMRQAIIFLLKSIPWAKSLIPKEFNDGEFPQIWKLLQDIPEISDKPKMEGTDG